VLRGTVFAHKEYQKHLLISGGGKDLSFMLKQVAPTPRYNLKVIE